MVWGFFLEPVGRDPAQVSLIPSSICTQQEARLYQTECVVLRQSYRRVRSFSRFLLSLPSSDVPSSPLLQPKEKVKVL